MLKSMTAYGRAGVTHRLGHFTVELQSVNRRYLEVSCSLPPEMTRFEADLRAAISTTVSRGKVFLRVTAQYQEGAPVTLTPNRPFLRGLQEGWQAVLSEVGETQLTTDQWITVLSQQEGLFQKSENDDEIEQLKKPLFAALEEALVAFIEQAQAEGEALAKDIVQRAQSIRNAVDQIHEKAADAPEQQRQKLKARLDELVGSSLGEHQDRILREIALYTDRVDITEEVVRCNSHLNQLDTALNGKKSYKGRSLGKMIDVYAQELLREINTIASKTGDSAVTELTIQCKGDIERIREQAQNVE